MVAIVLVIAVLSLCSVAAGLARTPVDAGTVALVRRSGELTGEVLEPGIHWRVPLIDQIEVVPTSVQSYEASDDPASSVADYADYSVQARAVDDRPITIRYTVFFSIPSENAVDVVREFGSVDRVVDSVVKASSRSWTRLLAQSYTAEGLCSGERVFEYEEAVESRLRQEYEEHGVVLDDFVVRRVE